MFQAPSFAMARALGARKPGTRTGKKAAPAAPAVGQYQPMSPQQIDQSVYRDVLGPAQAQLGALGSNFRTQGAYEASLIQQRIGNLLAGLAPFGPSNAATFGNAQQAQSRLGSALSGGLAGPPTTSV